MRPYLKIPKQNKTEKRNEPRGRHNNDSIKLEVKLPHNYFGFPMSFLGSTGKRGDYISQDDLIPMREVDATT